MKKLISLALALVMILSLATVAFAEDGGNEPEVPEETPTPAYNNTITFKKEFKNNNTEGILPTGNFSFKAEYVKYYNNEDEEATPTKKPTVTVSDGVYSATTPTLNNLDNIPINVTLNDADIGTFIYKITENDVTKCGITCATNAIYLKLQVTYTDDSHSTKQYYGVLGTDDTCSTKVDGTAFTNLYDSGKLTVSKKVTGNNVDPNKKFAFKVTFGSNVQKSFTSYIVATASSTDITVTTNANSTEFTFSLGNGDNVVFTNIPADVKYTVTEEADGYESTSSFSDPNKVIAASDQDTAEFTNSKNATIPTGVILESAPYILLLALAAAGMFLLLTKKRSREY